MLVYANDNNEPKQSGKKKHNYQHSREIDEI